MYEINWNSTSNNRPQNEALGNKPHKLCIYSPEPRTEVYCMRLNFNISKLVYCFVSVTLALFHCPPHHRFIEFYTSHGSLHTSADFPFPVTRFQICSWNTWSHQYPIAPGEEHLVRLTFTAYWIVSWGSAVCHPLPWIHASFQVSVDPRPPAPYSCHSES